MVAAFNECASESTNGCDLNSGAICSDRVDGYTCVCGTGYILSADGLSCEGEV